MAAYQTSLVRICRFIRKKVVRQNLKRRPCSSDGGIRPSECFADFMATLRNCSLPWEQNDPRLNHIGVCENEDLAMKEMGKIKQYAAMPPDDFPSLTGCYIPCITFDFSMDLISSRKVFNLKFKMFNRKPKKSIVARSKIIHNYQCARD